MDGRGRTFFLLQVFFCFFVFASTEKTKQMKRGSQKEIEDCSQVQCPGPLTYYHDMGCTPVYRNQGDCCAYKYNCDHLDARSPNKCYIKHRSYEVGEIANREDINLCDMTCVCSAGRNSTGFWCFYVDYEYSPSIGPSCYPKRNVHECGPGIPTCLKNESEVPRCVVDGYTYKAGKSFIPMNEPLKMCICQEGYTGDNIEPFCTTPSIRCSPDLYSNEDIANKNAPIYDWHEYRDINCNVLWRRQNENDTVIRNPHKSATPAENHSGENEDLTCKFGNLTMNIGDQLSPYTDYSSHRVNCTCEVPPIVTCKPLTSIFDF